MNDKILYALRYPLIQSMQPLWSSYLAVMNLKRARDAGTLTKDAEHFGQLQLYWGLLLDFLYNITVLSILFLELPREFLITQRVTRHKLHGKGWRKEYAEWFCVNLLDPFDPDGCHCK